MRFLALRPRLSRFPCYVQIWRERLRVSTPSRSGVFDDKPIVALDKAGRQSSVAAFGSSAELSGREVVRPFDHPRLVIHQFEVAAALMKHAFAQISAGWLIRPAPVAIVHPMEPPADGLTDIEERALRELALSAGAREVYLWQGRPLTSYDIAQGAYRDQG